MQLTSIRLVTAVALAAAITTGACSTPNSQSSGTGGTPGSGGSTGSGGSSTGSGGSNCPGGSPCGGSLVGTWTVSSSCLNLSGDMDVSLASLGCSTVPVSGSFHVTGTWTANADETYTDNTVTTGSITFPLAPSCLSVSSVQVACNKVAGSIQALGWASVTCSNDSSGNCSCSATANQNGGIGIVSPYAATSGNYTTSGSGLKVDDKVDYSYCASGSTLTLIPNTAGTAISGTIVLQKGGSGSGGSTGSGGSVASGGTTGSGGNTASGGTTGSGGNTASGGNTGSGGKGGATGSGGSAGSGGNTASGGTTGKGGGGGATGSGGSAGAAGASASGGATGTGGSSSGGMGPCDIYAAANTPCVAAHSTVRSLLGSYTGALYQVKRASDGTKKDIGIVGGLADSATQDTFCAGTTCTITLVYDQSGHGNLVEAETPDSTVGGHTGMTASNATQESLTLNGHKVYSLYMKTAQAYWRDGSKSGMPLGSSPQGIYMVTSGKHFGSGCCFDYGNGETSRMYVAGPSMDAVNFSNCTIWGTGAGTGPWVMADLEGGLYAKGGSGQSTADPSLTYTYVTAMEKNNGTGTFALKGGDASNGAISTFYSGSVPPGYNPAKKQGSIVLGSGGDCCYSNNTASQGTFYEGAIVAGYPSDATDTAIQANIVMAGYGK